MAVELQTWDYFLQVSGFQMPG